MYDRAYAWLRLTEIVVWRLSICLSVGIVTMTYYTGSIRRGPTIRRTDIFVMIFHPSSKLNLNSNDNKILVSISPTLQTAIFNYRATLC